MGNRTAVFKKNISGETVESEKYTYNDSNQLESVELYDGKKTTTIKYTYDEDGNLISKKGKIGTDKVETYYDYTVENRLEAVYECDELLMAAAYDGDGNRVFQLNYNLHTDEDGKGNSGNGNGNNKDNKGSGNNGKGKNKSEGTDDAGYGNATNAEENNSQNQSGILFPVSEEVSAIEQNLIDKIKTTGKQKNYELIEYINDVNREYVEVLVEQNINGKTDTSYVYGVERLSLERFNGSTGYYLYDPRGSVTGITNEEGQIYQSYRYSVTGEITFGAPQYENEYTYNGESYNPNIQSQYLRARYYNVVTATFLTEDSYLGEITNPLTLNRYNYTLSNYLNYQDPSGHKVTGEQICEIVTFYNLLTPYERYKMRIPSIEDMVNHLNLLDIIKSEDATVEYVTSFDYRRTYMSNVQRQASELSYLRWCENQEWIPEVMQINGMSQQEQNLEQRIDIINNNIASKTISNAEKELLYWNQEKIDKVWLECQRYYDKTGVKVDPRLLLAIIAKEGTGSFNTSSKNLAADGQNGINIDFDNDLKLVVDLLGGKL